jgi:hypothetical protein
MNWESILKRPIETTSEALAEAGLEEGQIEALENPESESTGDTSSEIAERELPEGGPQMTPTQRLQNLRDRRKGKPETYKVNRAGTKVQTRPKAPLKERIKEGAKKVKEGFAPGEGYFDRDSAKTTEERTAGRKQAVKDIPKNIYRKVAPKKYGGMGWKESLRREKSRFQNITGEGKDSAKRHEDEMAARAESDAAIDSVNAKRQFSRDWDSAHSEESQREGEKERLELVAEYEKEQQAARDAEKEAYDAKTQQIEEMQDEDWEQAISEEEAAQAQAAQAEQDEINREKERERKRIARQKDLEEHSRKLRERQRAGPDLKNPAIKPSGRAGERPYEWDKAKGQWVQPSGGLGTPVDVVARRAKAKRGKKVTVGNRFSKPADTTKVQPLNQNTQTEQATEDLKQQTQDTTEAIADATNSLENANKSVIKMNNDKYNRKQKGEKNRNLTPFIMPQKERPAPKSGSIPGVIQNPKRRQKKTENKW